MTKPFRDPKLVAGGIVCWVLLLLIALRDEPAPYVLLVFAVTYFVAAGHLPNGPPRRRCSAQAEAVAVRALTCCLRHERVDRFCQQLSSTTSITARSSSLNSARSKVLIGGASPSRNSSIRANKPRRSAPETSFGCMP